MRATLPVRTLPAPATPARFAVSMLAVSMLAVTLATILFVALRSPLKDDVAWLLYVARKWLGGQRLYVDLVEVNPPLIVWLSAVPASLAEWLQWPPKAVAVLVFAVATLASAWWSTSILRGAGPLFADRLPVFAVLGTVLIGVPGNELGQREHLLVAAALPYLCLLWRAMDGEATDRRTAILVGMVAALGCALKPRYGLAFAAVELLAVSRGVRPVRAMTVAAVLTGLAYAASVVAFYPDYLRRAVPLAMALYGATDVTLVQLAADSLRLLTGLAVGFMLWAAARRVLPEQGLILVLLVFAAGATIVCFIDGKNWFYHRIPGTVATALALLCWTGAFLLRKPSQPGWSLAAALLTLGLLAAGSAARLQPAMELAVDPHLSTEAKLERLIKKEKAKTYIAFSQWIGLGFPVVNETGVIWASRFDSMWALKGELWRAGFDPSSTREWPIRRWVVRDFIAACPDLAVVDTREGLNYVAVLSASDPAFGHAWSSYRQIAAFDGLRVYRRDAAACEDAHFARR